MGVITNSRNWRQVRLLAIVVNMLLAIFSNHIQPGSAMQQQPFSVNGNEECVSSLLAATPIPKSLDRLCGQLVFLEDIIKGKFYLGLQVCGRGPLLIFQVRPKELHKYYQLSEVKIGRGATISTNSGKFNLYITTFESYKSLQSCAECGQYSSPTPRELIGAPVGTQVLVFPTATLGLPTSTYTHTPLPSPTAEPFTATPPLVTITATTIPSATLNSTPEASPIVATPTLEITPPVGNSPSGLPNNSIYILFGVAIAFILTLGTGIIYLRRRLR